MKGLKLLLLTFVLGCTEKPTEVQNTILLIENSTKAVDEAIVLVYHQIRKNAYEYHERGIPWLRKAEQLDSVFDQFYFDIEKAADSKSGFSKSEYLKRYIDIKHQIGQVLSIESLELPEWYKIGRLAVDLDSFSFALIPTVMKLNLALIKLDALRILDLMAPSVFESYGPKSIYVVNEKVFKNSIQFDLSSRIFSGEEDCYTIIDSVFRNKEEVSVFAERLDKFTFQQIFIDSLSPGSYELYGKVIGFPKGIEKVESFIYEFEVGLGNADRN